MSEPERWHLEHAGHVHVVTVREGTLRRQITWTVDGTQVATRATTEDRVALADDDFGSVALHFRTFSGTRRVIWFAHTTTAAALAAARALQGGEDFSPEPGSAAQRRLSWISEHPRLHTLKRTTTAALGVAAGVLATWLIGRVLARIPWPEIRLPRIPWPRIDWPQIPWPRIPWPRIDWPPIPWPQIPWPDLSLPGWIGTLADAAKFVAPVLIALALAIRETRRGRRRREMAHHPPPDDVGAATTRNAEETSST